jgi:hypothetical protein
LANQQREIIGHRKRIHTSLDQSSDSQHDEACEESFISIIMTIKPRCKLASLSLYSLSSQSIQSLFTPSISRLTIGDLALRTGSPLQSLCNDGTQWFFAVAAFSIPVHSKDFAEKLSKWLFWAKFFTKRVTTALFWLRSLIPVFAEGRVVEGTLPLFKERKLSKKLFSTATDTTQPELK